MEIGSKTRKLASICCLSNEMALHSGWSLSKVLLYSWSQVLCQSMVRVAVRNGRQMSWESKSHRLEVHGHFLVCPLLFSTILNPTGIVVVQDHRYFILTRIMPFLANTEKNIAFLYWNKLLETISYVHGIKWMKKTQIY